LPVRALALAALLIFVALLLFEVGGTTLWGIYGGTIALVLAVLSLLHVRILQPDHGPVPRQGAVLPPIVEPALATPEEEPLPVLVLPDLPLSPTEVVHWVGVASLKEDISWGLSVDANEEVVRSLSRLKLRERGRGRLVLTNRRLLLLGNQPRQIPLSSVMAAEASWQAVTLCLHDSAHRSLLFVEQPHHLARLIGRACGDLQAHATPPEHAPDTLWAAERIVPFSD